jgi:twinkle protein
MRAIDEDGARRLTAKVEAALDQRLARPKVVQLRTIDETFRGPAQFKAEVAKEIREPTELTGATLPWFKTWSQFRLREREVTIWAGAKGTRKTMLLSHIAIDLALRHRQIVVFDSREMPHGRQLRRIISQALCEESPEEGAQGAFLEDLAETFALRDLQAPEGYVGTLGAIQRAAELGYQHYFLDNLSCVIPAGNNANQVGHEFVSRVADISHRLGIHVHLASHTRKPAPGLRRSPDGDEIKGSGSLGNLADNVVMFWRDKALERRGEKTSDDPDLVIIVDKQRNADWEGPIPLWVDRRYMRFVESALEPVKPYWESK